MKNIVEFTTKFKIGQHLYIATYSNPAMAHDKHYTNVAHSGRPLCQSNWMDVISAGGITNVTQDSFYIILTDVYGIAIFETIIYFKVQYDLFYCVFS